MEAGGCCGSVGRNVRVRRRSAARAERPAAPASPVAGKSAVQTVAIVYKRKGQRAKYRGKRYRYATRYHSWHRKWWKQHLHSRKYVGEKYHRHCGDWHRCHYYFYGYLQWQKWNPGGSRKYFLKRYHHY